MFLAEFKARTFPVSRNANMNTSTQQIIEFLTHPELPFGTEEDVLLMSDPESLQFRVASLLEEFPAVLGNAKTQELQALLANVDWAFIAQEFRARVEVTSTFFEADAQNAAGN